MRFLVIGASGFVGRHVLAHARSLGYEAMGTQSSARTAELTTFNLLTDRIHECLPRSWIQNGGPTTAVVCAAVTQIDRCAQEGTRSEQINVGKTVRLFQDLTALGANVVYLSSSFVFDGKVGYYNETDAHAPLSAYGRHKAAVECYLADRLPEALVLRLDKMVGDHPSERHLFSEWWQWVTAGEPIVCMEGQVFSPTFVDDAARAIILAAQEGLSGVFNVANSEFFSRVELAGQFLRILKCEGSIVAKSQEALNFLDLRPPKSYLDATKFVRSTGMRFASMREVLQAFGQRLDRAANLMATQPHHQECLSKPPGVAK